LDLNAGHNNPYRDLVEKYEALLQVQRSSMKNRQQQQMSLQDELMNSGDFRFRKDKDDDAKKSEAGSSTGTRRKTPTNDFSETETTSSGFSDETSNKATQTEERSGSFLCTIADGEDCKFTIYDDASPIESRFRDRPKYRELFREIFTVLKKAAENKDEGEQLPLLDDQEPVKEESKESKVPPVTPATEDIPVDFDAQSVISSAVSEHSIAVSECITKSERKKIKASRKQSAKDKEDDENRPPTGNRQSLEFYAIMNAKKKSRRSRRHSKDKYAGSTRDSSVAEPSLPDVGQIELEEKEKENQEIEKPESPITPTNSRAKRERRKQQMIQTFSAITSEAPAEWNGNSLTIYNRNVKAPKATPPPWNESQFRPSAASQELHKLKKLDLSYAEVLKNPRAPFQKRRK
jgi:hypothetical protein